MNKFVTKVSAFLLALWYCLSVIGFDVHTCHSANHQFVSTFIEGLTCEEIHSAHKCGHHCTHHHECSDAQEHFANHSDGLIEETDSCTDDYHALSITGTRSEDDHHHFHGSLSCWHTAAVLDAFGTDVPVPYSIDSYLFAPSSAVFQGEDVLSYFGIRRI